MNIMPANTDEKRTGSKYDRLIAAAKAVPVVSTIPPLRRKLAARRRRGRGSRHHQADPCRAGVEDQGDGDQI
jgi:hypothetical protein